MKTPKLTQILLAGALLLGGASFYPHPAPAQVVQQTGNGQIDWTNGQIMVTGSGAAPSKGSMSTGQKRLMAQRAAVADAYRQLAELVNGVNVDAETVVRDFVTESDVVRTRVSALIKGAQVGKPRYLSDGTVEIDVTLGVFGKNSLASVIVPPALEKHDVQLRPTPEPQISIPSATPETPLPAGSYTGVIVDCRGTGVKPAMSPRIVDANGQELYIGQRPIDPDMVVNIGIVGYVDSDSKARANSRVGSNPLMLKAVKAGGRFKTDAVISNDKGAQMLQADSRSDFLSRSKVLFIVDK
ncbi:MAG: hypothetical protein CVV27_09005 [Candidatus Melainabacteria bacterium HGW-Melainabacteria-1]|nr:MAG: hypothetical protein CVV27_09005 [Candidatus Melainabacteria bacterium HGW-Melainabacteria-1]